MKIELKWAIIYAVMTMVWSLIAKMMGYHDENVANGTVFNTLIILPSVIIYVLAMREKKMKYYDGRVSYVQIFKSGMILTLFVTILGPVYPIFANLISPDMLENVSRFMVNSNQMSAADAAEQITLSGFIIQGVIASVVFGLVYSAIISIFLRTKSPGRLANA